MAFQKNQPIRSVVIYDQDGNEMRSIDENGVDRIPVESFSDARLPDLVIADVYKGPAVIDGTAIADFIAIDLSNNGGNPGTPGAGPYKHDEAGAGIKIRGLSAQLIKTDVKDPYNVKFGVLTRVGVSDVDIVWFTIGHIHGSDTDRTTERIDPVVFPLELDLTVVANDLPKIAGGQLQTDATLDNTTVLKDLGDNDTLIAEGDVILRVEPESPGGTTDTATVSYQFWYVAE